MPELPEVETTRRGISAALRHATIDKVIIRQPKLRWPIPKTLASQLRHQTILAITRRGKYLLLLTTNGTIIIHLGMSGCLRILAADTPIAKHDHVDFMLDTDLCLRYTDPRRFGTILWTPSDPFQHRLIASLGVEPLTPQLTGEYLYQQSRKRSIPIKVLLMNSKVVVGVGNIYATESLFLSQIHPLKIASTLTQQQCCILVKQIKHVLHHAIKAGGTTLKDFYSSDGKPGYFKQHLNVYGKAGELCECHRSVIKKCVIAQRSTFFCPVCQTD